MGRPRTATKILSISGSFKAHPERKRSNEPIPLGVIGPPPKHFSGEGDEKALKEAWNEVVTMTPAGVLTDADRLQLEIVCNLIVEYRKDPPAFMAAKLTRLESMIGKFGLNPSDRSRIVTPGKPKSNAFNGI